MIERIKNGFKIFLGILGGIIAAAVYFLLRADISRGKGDNQGTGGLDRTDGLNVEDSARAIERQRTVIAGSIERVDNLKKRIDAATGLKHESDGIKSDVESAIRSGAEARRKAQEFLDRTPD